MRKLFSHWSFRYLLAMLIEPFADMLYDGALGPISFTKFFIIALCGFFGERFLRCGHINAFLPHHVQRIENFGALTGSAPRFVS